MRQEFHTIRRHWPNLERIRDNCVNMLTCAGASSEDVYYARTAWELAEAVGCPYRAISGHHLSYAANPVTFAEELRGLLAVLQARRPAACNADGDHRQPLSPIDDRRRPVGRSRRRPDEP